MVCVCACMLIYSKLVFFYIFNVICYINLQDDFSAVDHAVNGPRAFFANMPQSKTLTMNLDVPEPWLVEPVIAMYVCLYFFNFSLTVLHV